MTTASIFRTYYTLQEEKQLIVFISSFNRYEFLCELLFNPKTMCFYRDNTNYNFPLIEMIEQLGLSFCN